MDRLESMSVFVEVVDAGSLSAAGRRLGMPLATVSRKIAELESQLGTRLLNRSSRKLMLTHAGGSYLAACQRILAAVEEAERAASGEYSAPKGELVITAPVVFGRLHVLPIAIEFLKTYPDIDVRMHLLDGLANLFEEQVDLAVRIGELPDSSLVATPLGSISRIVCASPGYLRIRGCPTSPTDLSEHDCVTFDRLGGPREWNFHRAGADDIAVTVHSRLVVNTAEAAIDAAIAGLGITRVLSYQAADAIAAGTLARVLDGFDAAASPVNLVFVRQGPVAQKLRAFIDFATPRLRSTLTRLDEAARRVAVR